MAKLVLKHKGVFSMLERLEGDEGGSKILDIFHWNDVELYTTNTEQLLILITVVSTTVENSMESATFDVPALYNSVETSLMKLRALLVDHRTSSTCGFHILTPPLSRTRMTSIVFLKMSFGWIQLHSYDLMDRKEN